MTDVSELDALPSDRAGEMFSACCGSTRWVERMLALRPFGSRGAVCGAADEVWWSLSANDWREAFAHHPRIGAKMEPASQSTQARAWAAGEQSQVSHAPDDVRDQLALANQEYERRFGYIYIVCATGKSAAEMLTLARNRLDNAPEVELRIAAEEQRKITRLRLAKLLDENAKGDEP